MRAGTAFTIAARAIDVISSCIFISTIVAVVCRQYMQASNDPFKCKATLTQGEWLDPPNSDRHSSVGLQNWQPPGCYLKRYAAQDMAQCLAGKQIVYVGDSTIRQLYWATARKIDAERAYQDQHVSQKHSDKLFQKEGYPIINFVWDPYLNSTSLTSQLHSMNAANKSKAFDSATALMIIGGGLWHARYLQDEAQSYWKERIEHMTSLLHDTRPWDPQSKRPLRLVSPVQRPLYDSLNQERRQSLRPASIESMNDHLLKVSVGHDIQVPFVFNRMLERQPAAYEKSGLHASINTADHMVDVALNMVCNSILAQTRRYPMDMTCCSSYARPSIIQRILLGASGSLVLALILSAPYTYLKIARKPTLLQSPIVKAAGMMAIAVMYCYYADRTQLFEKSQKQFSLWEFKIYLAIPTLIGFITIRRSASIFSIESTRNQNTDQPFLSRDQTDEWKGWMQIVILVYHYAGGSSVLPIYEAIRVLVAAYLFMTGFGHAIFYYKKPDYSLRRVAAVLIRLNMLSVILPYFMRTDYLFYYFAPLTSLFYLVIYLTMIIGYRSNGNATFLIGKIIFAAGLTNLAIRTPAVLDRTFDALAGIFNIHWNVNEWRFRLQLDSIIVFTGMISGIVFLKIIAIRRMPPSTEERSSLFIDIIRHQFHHIRLVAITLAVLTVPIIYAFAANAPNKYTYNAYVPYVSIFPILAFIILRNSTRTLRNHHSVAFAWVGRISLETFTLQFHVWLAADTKGLLRTGVVDKLYGRYADMAVLTVIFLWIAKKVSDATARLTGWIVEGGGNGERSEAGGHVGLPRVKSKDFGKGATGAEEEAQWWWRVVEKVQGRIAGDLRMRLLLIFVTLWALNWAQ